MRKCFYCAENIQDDAKICKYCGKNIKDEEKTNNDSGIILLKLGGVMMVLGFILFPIFENMGLDSESGSIIIGLISIFVFVFLHK